MEETSRANKRKTKKGIVISNKMVNTVVVAVDSVKRHPRYEKVVTIRNKFYAHHEGKPLQIGDEVIIQETRPISKMKRWRVV